MKRQGSDSPNARPAKAALKEAAVDRDPNPSRPLRLQTLCRIPEINSSRSGI